ncbi:response regulator receiver modulated diguanylate cyclase [Yoonia maricola]|uniref:diguanylate cyclase n=1 Tax=Yoonia maricola TaxID=420999 RepID=A0A2M8W292_9RHOB|nr:diguanylate cyclase [Yoonia maricola]PJI85028.1 response regulator receiver modulated diguanylate cyclase [Yoonia maricola]
MPGRVLIIDTVATNRIVLKVKMLAAQFAVDACASKKEALRIIDENRPDLILMNLSDDVLDQHSLCHDLRRARDTATISIIAVGVADTSRARFAALDAGADDVLPYPVNDALLLARIRSMLRVRSTSEELQLREGTSRALGFEENRTDFDGAAKVAVLAASGSTSDGLKTALQEGLHSTIHSLSPCDALQSQDTQTLHDLFVVDASDTDVGQGGLFGLVSDLRARAQTRLAMQLVVVPSDKPEIAAMFLDLGADDVMPNTGDTAEITLRAKRLIARKRKHDKLRDTVRNGLNAAVTDPLTGLFNRRYVEPHLARLAEQSRKSKRELAVMMIDIDHFKAVNDTHGHAAGDRVLVELADRLRENLRAVDLVARMGGEEFLVAMPGTSVIDARLAADRLRALVNTTPFELGDDLPAIKMTVSVGVAVSGQTKTETIAVNKMCDQADRALYAAKSAGRDQVAMSKSAA